MTKNLTRTMIAAAFALSTAGAFAQTRLTANIPFAFSTSVAHLSAGRYEIVPASSSNAGVLWIRNVATGEGTTLGIGMPAVPDDKGARLVFKCAGETCALAEVWRGNGGRGYKFSTPKVKPSELERVAVIYLDRKNGD